MKSKLFDMDAESWDAEDQHFQIQEISKRDVAIVGMSSNIAHAQNIQQFWDILRTGQDCIAPLPQGRKEDVDHYFSYMNHINGREGRPEYSEFAYLNEIDQFDYSFFGLSPKEAQLMDPNQRLFLQLAWEAIEDAGYSGGKIRGSKTGVFVGFGGDILYKQLIANVEPDSAAFALAGNLDAIIASRISYLLDLKGPSMLINTACSSALVAIYMACQEIRSGNCDLFLVGSININMLPVESEIKLGLESSSNRSRAFDDEADGTGGGEGGGVLVLKPLQNALRDGDHIYGVIKGCAINQDGSSNGITAPNPAAQEEVIVRAWEDARIDPQTITYIETHGTGTKLGDPIEFEGLQKAFRRTTSKKHFCAIGSVKSNIGHLNHAAGIAGIIKAVLSLHHKQLPPSLHIFRPNKEIDFKRSPLYINDTLSDWETEGVPRRCGVSSFGLSGTNCHIVLEEAPEVKKQLQPAGKGPYLLSLSAKSEEALTDLVRKYSLQIPVWSDEQLGDICYTANVGREQFAYRAGFCIRSLEELASQLESYLEGSNQFSPESPPKLTAQEKQELSAEAVLLVRSHSERDKADETVLSRLCQLYMNGADVPFQELYANQKHRLVSLPTYPFQKKRCWIDIPVIETGEEAMYHGVRWEASPQTSARAGEGDNVLIIGSSPEKIGSLAACFELNGSHAVQVLPGTDGFRAVNENAYTLSYCEDDYRELADFIANRHITRIIHFYDAEEISTKEQLEESQRTGVSHLFQLSKTLMNRDLENDLEVILITPNVNPVDGSESQLYTQYAPMLGLGKVVSLESFRIRCRYIDVDPVTTLDEIYSEICSEFSQYGTAYRKGIRYAEILDRLSITGNQDDAGMKLKENGVYVITGGLGGIGLEIAQDFASRAKVNLCLISRSSLPPKEEWDAVLAGSDNPKLLRSLRIIREIEQYGSEVRCYAADIAEEAQVAPIMDELRSRYGTIDGVIHGAGIIGEGLIVGKGDELFNRALSPKLYGTWLLDRLTRSDDLDFFVLFSSVTSLTGAPGHGAYTAGNSYLDIFAANRSLEGKKTVTVNWATWLEVGVAVDYGVNVDGLFKVLTTKDAIGAFHQLMESGMSRVIVGKINYEDEVVQLNDDSQIRLSADIVRTIRHKSKELESASTSPAQSITPVELQGREGEPYTDTELQVASIFGFVLGYESLNIDDNFYELGGDSILAIKIVNGIQQCFDMKVEISQILKNHPTVSGLAAYLDRLRSSEGERGCTDSVKAIQPVGKAGHYPVSASQKRLFTLNQFEPDNVSYNMPLVMRIDGSLNTDRIHHAVHELVARHEAFRTSFTLVDGEPVQIIHEEAGFGMENYQCREHEVDEVIRSFVRPFDLETAPLFRAALITVTDTLHLLLIDMHHIISDGTSISILIQEFADSYQGKELPPVRIQYKDYAVWQNDLLGTPYIERQEKYWLDSYSGELPDVQLPSDYPRPSSFNYEGDVYEFGIDPKATHEMRVFCQKNGATIFHFLLSAYYVLLSRLAKSEDIVVGVPVIGRSQEEVQSTIGMFINTIALRQHPAQGKKFTDLLNEVKENLLTAYENQDFQFEMLLEKIKAKREVNRTPLFDTVFNLQNTSFDHGVAVGDLVFTPQPFGDNSTKFDMTIHLDELADRIEMNCNYRTSLYKHESIKYLMGEYVELVRQLCADPNKVIAEYDLLNSTSLSKYCSAEVVERAAADTLVKRFEDIADRYENRDAVIVNTGSYSYGALNRQANQIAHAILDAPMNPGNAEAGRRVALLFEHGAEMIAAMLGTLKSGAAYVPLDPGFPAERLQEILESCSIGMIVTNDKNEGLSRQITGQRIPILNTNSLDESPDRSNPNVSIDSAQTAYIMYTSGSTGKPKGVVHTHSNVLAFIDRFTAELTIRPEDRISLFTSYTHAVGVIDILGALLSGAAVLPYDLKAEGGIDKLPAWLSWRQITIYHSIPSIFRYCFEEAVNLSPLEHIRLIILGGEAVYSRDVELFNATFSPSSQFVNLFGSSEVLIATINIIEWGQPISGKLIAAGLPVPEIELCIEADNGEEAGIFGKGEMVYRSRYLARGYWDNDESTEAAFGNSLTDGESAVFRSGDLARRLPDGTIEFLGRKDFQVKLRGYRIELNEIEIHLNHMNEIEKCVVGVVDGEEDEPQLVVCYETKNKLPLDKSHIQQLLKSKLPIYMVPSHYIHYETIPLTANYKIDRKELQKNMFASAVSLDGGTDPDIEMKLIECWKELLKADEIGAQANFFELGGHSLKATALISKIHRTFDVNISITDIFQYQTVREMAKLIAQANIERYAEIGKAAQAPYYPVSSSQKRMYLICQNDQVGTGYNVSGAVKLRGELDTDRFIGVFDELIQRHESLRTSFDIADGDVRQWIHGNVDFVVEQMECEDNEESIRQRVSGFIRPFNLGQAPLFRAALIRIDSGKHLFIYDMHHIIVDGTSVGLLIQDAMDLYEGHRLNELSIQYKDYAVWQHQMLTSDAAGRQREYWSGVFSGEIPILQLPLDYNRPAVKSFEGTVFTFEIGQELLNGLKQLAQREKATLNIVLLAAFQIVMAKYSRQQDIVVGTLVSGRTHVNAERVMGMFVNTLALRGYPEAGKAVADFIAETKESLLKALDHQNYPFDHLLQDLKVKTDVSRNPLFDVAFVLQNMERPELQLGGLTASPYPMHSVTSQFDLKFEANEAEEGIFVNVEYGTRLFKEETIRRMSAHYKNVLESICRNTEQKISEITLLTQEEQEQIRVINDTFAELYGGVDIVDDFESSVRRNPGKAALLCKDQKVTYAELNERANRLAWVLTDKGVGKDTIVGVMAERSVEMVVAILAILKSGGAYLPIDPQFPDERIAYMLRDSGARIILTVEALLHRIEYDVDTILLDQAHPGIADNLIGCRRPDSLAYVIYTSGSTGQPKGVMIEHGSLKNRLHWMQQNYPIGEKDVILQKTNYTFDVSVWEFLWPLSEGAALSLLEVGGEKDPVTIAETVAAHVVTVLHFVPSMLSVFLASAASGHMSYGQLSSLKYVFASGEALQKKTVTVFNEGIGTYGPCKLINLYGPTEATIDVTYYNCPADSLPDSIPIGKPISNTQVYVVHEDMQMQPIGVIGELCIGGAGVARGYINKPELTREKFVDNPFVPGQRMYRTGDLARWTSAGEIEYLGRMDHQCKVRGYRIELGEIEKTLLLHNSVTDAIVLAREDADGSKQLCAYVIAAQTELLPGDLRIFLAAKLPEYMIPSHLIIMDSFPLTANQKVDRKKLPEPQESANGITEYAAPADHLEALCVQILTDVLEARQVGMNDNYFELGGNSIHAIQISAAMYQQNYKLTVRDILRSPDIRGIARQITPLEKKAHQGYVSGEVVLTPIQKWFFGQDFAESHYWNQAVMLQFNERVDPDKLVQCFSGLIAHHDALRMTYRLEGEAVSQFNRGPEGEFFSLEKFDFREISDFASRITEESERIQGSIRLDGGQLVKLGLFQTAQQDHLLIAIHHLVIDAVSWRILLEDLYASYSQASGQTAIRMKSKTHSFMEWADFLNQYADSSELLKEAAYWHELADMPCMPLPKDFPDGVTPETGPNMLVSMELNEEETNRLLHGVHQAYNTDMNDILLTALGLALKDWTQHTAFTVYLEGHGREELFEGISVSRTVGWFTSLYPVHLDMEYEDLSYQIKTVKESLRQIPSKGIGFGILAYMTDLTSQDLALKVPEPDICFNYLGEFGKETANDMFRLSDISAGATRSPSAKSPYSLDINGVVAEGRLSISFTFAPQEYKSGSITKLSGMFKDHLRALIEHCSASEAPQNTPSDYGTRDLSIEEVEDILEIFKTIHE
ncbi:non-ribosomal peptide synthetase [Paenibacillus sp. FJAT-26967]|uniref:non-ribosomal peptide synthetase n=1 Tax=Paenibacillus sp. FJAT-26967 TaxID=1729690 RepID=UPI000839643F|nr:non-ribosomal peptide synthetase [Paenibacillus sp. FJAT-26967]